MTPLRALVVACFATTHVTQAVAQTDLEAVRPLPNPPGKLVDVGGRKLHLLCTGQGAPTIVLEAGASSFAIDWTLVQRETSRTNRTCSYDRAGLGWSDETTPANRASVAADLRRLLTVAEIRSPYVLVGASRGGFFIRAYLREHPEDVVGMVFVDPSTEDRLFTMINGQGVAIADVSAEQLKTTFPTRWVRIPRRSPQRGVPFDRLPANLYQTRIALDEKLIASAPDSVPPEVVASGQEAERAFLASLKATRSAQPHPFGDRPTVVLTRGDEVNSDRAASHATLAALSTISRHSVVAGAGHEIHLFEPSAVVTAIADVLKAVHEKTRLIPRP